MKQNKKQNKKEPKVAEPPLDADLMIVLNQALAEMSRYINIVEKQNQINNAVQRKQKRGASKRRKN